MSPQRMTAPRRIPDAWPRSVTRAANVNNRPDLAGRWELWSLGANPGTAWYVNHGRFRLARLSISRTGVPSITWIE